MPSPADHRLIVFVKAPRPGFVKTRLAADLGPEAAGAAYRSLVDHTCRRLAGLRAVELRFSPDDAAAEIRPWLAPGWTLAPQGAGDLGDRMHAAFVAAFAAGATRVALIGSDCPALEAGDITAAWEGLATHDVVLGPATDGGYWLVALRAPQPALFADMVWSTADVLAKTLARAGSVGLTVHLLRPLSDIDTLADWQAWQAANLDHR